MISVPAIFTIRDYGVNAVSVNTNFAEKLCVRKSSKSLSPWLKQLGDNIRRERAARGMSQQGLAERADLNIRNVQRIEAGEINVILTTTVRLANALECPIEKLIPKSNP